MYTQKYVYNFFIYVNNVVWCLKSITMLGGSLVITAWSILRLWMEGTDLRYIGQLRINTLRSEKGTPPAWGLGVWLTTLHRKK
jgi:hypothetical protein